MITSKNTIISIGLLTVALVSAVVYFSSKTLNDDTVGQTPDSTNSPLPSVATPTASPKPIVSKVPLPTSDGRTTFINETVPWSLLLADASCELKGEIKYLNSNTYDNQDALFIYKGIDNPGRNVFWTVTPQDNILVGPNIFSNIPIPNGESLLGISLPENPKHKTYDITAKIQYGRLVDANGKFVTAGGTVKIFEKQCTGKTTVVLP